MIESAEPHSEGKGLVSAEPTWSRREVIQRGAWAVGGLGLSLGALAGAKPARARVARVSTQEVHFFAVNNATGSGGFVGTGTQRIEHLLADKVNAAGGFKDAKGNRYTIRLSDFDMGDSREAAVAGLRKAAGDKSVVAVIAPGSDLGWLSMIPLAGELKVPMIIPSDGSPVTKWNPYAVRIAAPATKGVGIFVRKFGKKLGLDQMALIYDTAFASESFEGKLWESDAKTFHYRLSAVETFRTGDNDFSAQLTAIKAKKPKWVLIVAQPPELIKIVNQMAAMGIKAKIYGSYADGASTEAWKGTNGLVKGSYFFSPGFPSATTMQNPEPYKLYMEKYHDVPIIFHVFGWDALNVAMDIVKRSGSATNREAFRAAMGNTHNFPLAAAGHINWKNPPSGDNLTPPIVVGQVTGSGTAKIIGRA